MGLKRAIRGRYPDVPVMWAAVLAHWTNARFVRVFHEKHPPVPGHLRPGLDSLSLDKDASETGIGHGHAVEMGVGNVRVGCEWTGNIINAPHEIVDVHHQVSTVRTPPWRAIKAQRMILAPIRWPLGRHKVI